MVRDHRTSADWTSICATVAFAVVSGLALAARAATGGPVALVESVSPALPDVQEMAYLATGAVIGLPSGTTLVLDYMNSCVRETITGRPPSGGQVKIGTDDSTVTASNVRRERAECDGKGLLQLAASESDVGGGAVWRDLPGAILPDPDLTLQSTVPIIVAPIPGAIRIERLGVRRPAIDGLLVRGPGAVRASLDVATIQVRLEQGGLYRITLGDRSRIVLVSPSAGGADAPMLARLLPL